MQPVVNEAFVDAGQKPGVEIWRIENFKPVPYPSKNHGKFYEGDSYVVLKTTEDPHSKKLSWDIHFWLGAETSGDELGAAAVYAVQLDDQLGGAPVQHREVQDHESQSFLSYFKNGVRYEKGGVATGFQHVDVNAAGETRLFQVKGKRNVRVRQVAVSIESMNRGDCFILDAGKEILVYVGENSKRLERLKAIYAANEIRDQDHHGRSNVNIIDNFSSDFSKEQFFSALGSGSPDEVPAETVDEEDGAFEEADIKAVTLYKVSDASGALEIEKISEKPLRQEMLNTDDSFILDTGSGIYIWIGRNSTQKEKTSAMKYADHFLESKSYPAWTQVHRVVEDGEPAPFKQYFATWRDQGLYHKRLVRTALGYSTDDSDYEEPDDVDTVLQNLKKSGGNAIAFMPDHGENDIEHIIKFSSESDDDVVRSIVDFEGTTPLIGQYAYIITYKYSARSGESGKLIYVWEGARASEAVKERSFNDGLAMAIEDNAILVRTAQSHEPRHFLKIFKGKLITPFADKPKAAQLFRVRGTDASDVHASEVACKAMSLVSGDVFALVTLNHKVYIWIGQGASDFEKTSANERFEHYWPYGKTVVIEEGSEPSEFWEELHSFDRDIHNYGAPLLEPRLFHCQLVAWRTKVEEIRHFQQSDLDVDDVMLLDAGDEIYMCVGSGATVEENAKILLMAKKYIKQEPTDRTIDSVSVIRITQGNEPRVFTRMFPTWDNNYWKEEEENGEEEEIVETVELQIKGQVKEGEKEKEEYEYEYDDEDESESEGEGEGEDEGEGKEHARLNAEGKEEEENEGREENDGREEENEGREENGGREDFNDDNDEEPKSAISKHLNRKNSRRVILGSGPTDMVESVSEKAIAGKRLKNGVEEYYRVLTLDVKNIFNKADWEQIMSAIQQQPENTRYSIPDFEDVVEAIEIPTFNQTHWNSINDAIARQQNPNALKIGGAADDIALEVIKRHLTDVEAASNAEVVLVQDWLNTIGLQMAEKKTDVVLKSRIKKVEQERVKEGNLLLKAKPEIGYLGLLLNTKLKFKHLLQYADKHVPTKSTALLKAHTVSDAKNLKKMALVMNVSTAALLYPSNSKRDSSHADKRLKLIVETKYNVERQLLSGKDEGVEEKPMLEAAEEGSDFVNLVLVDERKRWKMRRTESLPDVSQME